MMIPSSVVCYFLFIGYVAAMKIDLREICAPNTIRCTVSDCSDEKIVFENTEARYDYTEIVFRNCYLPAIPSTIFSITPKLERFLMFKCSTKIIHQSNFLTASNLRSLYMPNNRLTELTEKIFYHLSLVEEIHLANNHISHMHPKAFTGLLQLRILELSNNKINSIALDIFRNLSALEYIDLSYNDIETIDSTIFEANLELKTILLNNNNFAVFESNSLAHLVHLNVLDISYNTIGSIRLQSVDTLRAQNSQLRSCVINGSAIKVRASNNQLKYISITNKNSVKEIDVHSNQFDSLADFHGMLNLQKLDLSKNALQNLYSSNSSQLLELPSLQILNLAFGQLQSITTDNFLLLGKLSHLDLAYNNLQVLDANAFEPLVNLEKIYFEGNHLHLFDYETFMGKRTNFKEMGIFGNNWSQNYLAKMLDHLKTRGVRLIIRSNSNEENEMMSLQSTSHSHHTVHTKTLEHGGTHSSEVNGRDVLIIVTMCLVFIILFLQLFRTLRDENVFNIWQKTIRRTNRPTRLDEEESEPL